MEGVLSFKMDDTKAFFGFRVKGKDCTTYRHSNAGFNGLGMRMLEYVSQTPVSLMRLVAVRTELVDSLDMAPREIVEHYEKIKKKLAIQLIGNNHSWGNVVNSLSGGLYSNDLFVFNEHLMQMLDSKKLPRVSWDNAYIVDVDKERLEFYQKFVAPYNFGRYSKIVEELDSASSKHNGVILVREFSFDEVKAAKDDFGGLIARVNESSAQLSQADSFNRKYFEWLSEAPG